MRPAVSILALLLIVCTLPGCTSVEFRPTLSARHYPPYAGEVEVLDAFPESAAYELLGVVSVYGGGVTRERSMMKALLKEAASRGADAVVVQGPVKERPTLSGSVQQLAATAIRRER